MSLHVGVGKGPGHLDRMGGLLSSVSPFQPDAVFGGDFRNNQYKGPAVSNSNASGGYVDDSLGNWTFVGPNLLRRSDKGLLVEGQQTNLIRNSSNTGAAAGAYPTFWNGSLGGTQTIVGPAIEKGVDGIYLDLSAATPPVGQLIYVDNVFTAATPGQLFSTSIFHRLVSGDITSLGVGISLREYDSTQTFLRQTIVPLNSTSAMGRAVNNVTIGASTAFIQIGIRSGGTTGAYSGRLFVAWPQLEQWSSSVTTVGGASSPIRTVGTAAARAADSVTTTLTNSLNSYTAIATVNPNIPTISGCVFRLGIASDRAEIRQANPQTGANATIQFNSAGQASPFFANAFVFGSRSAIAAGYASGDAGLSAGSSAPATSAPTSVPVVSALQVGGGTAPWNGYIEKLQILPRRASNTELQAFSTLAA